MELVGKATDAGVPINFHQLSDNKFMKIIGETAENVPLAGGGSLRAKRREAFNLALAKQMDPETDITVLDDASFKQLQDAAGERIGEISSKYQVPAADFGDLMTLDRARRSTPDTKAVVQAWAEDLKKIAEENGGFVPGDTCGGCAPKCKRKPVRCVPTRQTWPQCWMTWCIGLTTL